MRLLLLVAVLCLLPACFGIVNYTAVKNDIKALLTQSKDFFPADVFEGAGHYGPLMIRQAWHCAGSYRTSDGQGGCDGARQRFDPERSWDDNTNLDKPKRLLWPVKQKYGNDLSWGDLIVLAGDAAIESMGGPIIGFCGGRIDDADGSDSVLLGPTAEQQAVMPCADQGDCKAPLGPTTIGLIYVNPEGPKGDPKPELSAPQIRDTFGRMAMNDYETVALIGGGHAFGKTHGACPMGPGPSPAQDPVNPWPYPSACGAGKIVTSGFEGSWSYNPTKWSNQYFVNLLNNTWEVYRGPGGHFQWKITNSTSPLMMLTSDVALTRDDTYARIAREFANDQQLLNQWFSRAWYKLMSRDVGPVTRCVGDLTPAPQPFQYPLPASTSNADFGSVKTEIKNVMYKADTNLTPDNPNNKPYYGAVFVYLAYQCASTFRRTDYVGGCNGARIRTDPQNSWAVNTAMDKAMAVLQPVKDKFGNALSWADLIVAAGQVALEESGAKNLSFCPGRSDVNATSMPQDPSVLSPNLNMTATALQHRMWTINSGLTSREMVALSARPRSPVHQGRLGYVAATWTDDASKLSNEYFQLLLNEQWSNVTSPSGLFQYKATKDGKDLYMVQTDMNIRYESDWLAIAQEYALNNDLFLFEFSKAWTKLMNIDRFQGPTGNLCSPSTPSSDSSSSGLASWAVALISVLVTLVVAIGIYCVCLRQPSKKQDTLLA